MLSSRSDGFEPYQDGDKWCCIVLSNNLKVVLRLTKVQTALKLVIGSKVLATTKNVIIHLLDTFSENRVLEDIIRRSKTVLNTPLLNVQSKKVSV
jgi:hypothetical protein